LGTPFVLCKYEYIHIYSYSHLKAKLHIYLLPVSSIAEKTEMFHSSVTSRTVRVTSNYFLDGKMTEV
jgi:hypothetical protein